MLAINLSQWQSSVRFLTEPSSWRTDSVSNPPPPLDSSALLALLSSFSSVSLVFFSLFSTSLTLPPLRPCQAAWLPAAFVTERLHQTGSHRSDLFSTRQTFPGSEGLCVSVRPPPPRPHWPQSGSSSLVAKCVYLCARLSVWECVRIR